ncbi:MAG: hypothetical protein AABZ74_12385, partial [Cyanobacteriota bacterium]
MSWLENLFISEENKLKIAEIKLYIQNENYDRALLILDTIIGSRTVFIDLYLLEAYCHIKKENYELATKKLYKVFDIDKNSSEGIYYKGLIYKGLNDYDNSLDNLRKAINLGYDKYNIYNDLADLYIQKKEYDKAFIQLKISLTKENNNLNTYKKIVNILIEQNNIEMIIDFCNKALDVKSDIFFIDILSQTYLKNNDDVKALELLQNYIKVFSYPEIYTNLAKIYIKNQKYDLALENIEKGLVLFSDNLDLKIQKMEVCYYKKDYLGIIKTSKKVLIQELDNYKILLYLGISFFYTKEKEKAILYLEESYKLKKDSLNCCYLSLIFFDDKKIEISFNLLFEALELTENQSQKLEIYQKIYFNYDKIANKEKALEFAKKALEIAKDNEKTDIQKFIANLHKERNSSAIENENDFKNY